MSAPTRVQLSRKKGSKRPPNTVAVDRRTQWGNRWVPVRNRVKTARGFERKGPHWVVIHVDRHGHEDGLQFGCFDTKDEATLLAVQLHRQSIEALKVDIDGMHRIKWWIKDLVGKNTGCWCAPGSPCHADYLLELAAEVALLEAEDEPA